VKEISTGIEISAPPERVWAILADTARWGEWNPFIPTVEGALAVGERLKVRIKPPGGPGMTFRPKLLKVDPARELRWLGSLLVPGVLDGEHAFELARLGAAATQFRQSERFSGMLVPLFAGALGKAEAGFRAMNEALKARAEAAERG
jgi:hypothetical protein